MRQSTICERLRDKAAERVGRWVMLGIARWAIWHADQVSPGWRDHLPDPFESDWSMRSVAWAANTVITESEE